MLKWKKKEEEFFDKLFYIDLVTSELLTKILLRKSMCYKDTKRKKRKICIKEFNKLLKLITEVERDVSKEIVRDYIFRYIREKQRKN